MKKIVVVAGDYPAEGHMRLVFVQQLVHSMIDQGTELTVVAPQSIAHSVVHKVKLLPKVTVEHTAKGKQYYIYRPYIITAGNSLFLSRFLKVWNSMVLNRILKRVKPDVLYAHFWSSIANVELYARKYNTPIFVACGEGDNALEEMVKKLSEQRLKQLTTYVKGVISVSTENKRKCIEYNLAKKEDIVVLPNCVDSDLFSRLDKTKCRRELNIPIDDFVVIFVGGFIPRKGPDRLAQAICELNNPNVKVIFVGKEFPGYPYEFSCPGIVYKGVVEHNKLPVFLSAADIFVLPTQKEGCCNAIVEALSIGLPVVSSDGSFNDDILDESNSIRVDSDSVKAIKEAILTLKNNPALRKQMTDFSINRHELYSVRKRAQKILAFINQQLSKVI